MLLLTLKMMPRVHTYCGQVEGYTQNGVTQTWGYAFESTVQFYLLCFRWEMQMYPIGLAKILLFTVKVLKYFYPIRRVGLENFKTNLKIFFLTWIAYI